MSQFWTGDWGWAQGWRWELRMEGNIGYFFFFFLFFFCSFLFFFFLFFFFLCFFFFFFARNVS